MQDRPPAPAEALGPPPHTRIIPKKRLSPPVVDSQRRFRGQLQSERISAVRRPSLLLAVGPCIPLAVGLSGILLWHQSSDAPRTFTFLSSVALVLVSAPLATRAVSGWLGQVFILTDRRVVIQSGIMHQQIQQVELANVVQVVVERPHLFQMLVGIGTVSVRPQGSQLRLRGVSRPRDLADMILTMREQNALMLAAIPAKPVVRNHRLQAAIDSLDPGVPDPVFTPSPPAPLKGLLHRRLPVRLLMNESVVELVYRHWIVLFRRELPAAALLGLTILAFMGLHTVAPGGTTLLVVLVGLAITAIFLVLTYVDWADDVFILTTHRVIDIDRLFLLLAEYSNEVLHSKIQDIQVRQGFWGRFFGYGAIKVLTAGGEHERPLEMRNIPDAKGLQNRIFAQVEQVRKRDLNMVRNRQRLDASRWMSQVLDELMVEVPDLTGLALLRAVAQARKAGLRLAVDGERATTGVSSGVVLEQAPPAGTMALADEGVHVVISGQTHSFGGGDGGASVG